MCTKCSVQNVYLLEKICPQHLDTDFWHYAEQNYLSPIRHYILRNSSLDKVYRVMIIFLYLSFNTAK